MHSCIHRWNIHTRIQDADLIVAALHAAALHPPVLVEFKHDTNCEDVQDFEKIAIP
jgi:hypothetical protein